MSENLTFAEIEAQHVELLPARTVLSLFSVSTAGKGGADGTAKPATGNGAGFNLWSGWSIMGTGTATYGSATPGAGGTAKGG